MLESSLRSPIEIGDTIDQTLITSRAGVPLVIELFRQLGVAQGDRYPRHGQTAAAGLARVGTRREPRRSPNGSGDR